MPKRVKKAVGGFLSHITLAAKCNTICRIANRQDMPQRFEIGARESMVCGPFLHPIELHTIFLLATSDLCICIWFDTFVGFPVCTKRNVTVERRHNAGSVSQAEGVVMCKGCGQVSRSHEAVFPSDAELDPRNSSAD